MTDYKQNNSDLLINNKYFSKEIKENVKLFVKEEEKDNVNLLIKKGDCSTDLSISKVSRGEVYDSHALTFYLYNFSALKIIDEYLGKNKIKDYRMLELGCNNGFVPRALMRNGFNFKEYWGVDFDFSFIVEGSNEFDSNDNKFNCNFVSGDFNKKLNFKDDSFDFIYFQEAFDHCKDKYFYSEQLLNEIKRILKKDSYLYITLVFEHEYRDLYHWDHNYIWSKFEFDNMIIDHFDIVNFTSLLTFEQSIKNRSKDENFRNLYKNWPTKFAKQLAAPFIPGEESAVGAYLLKNKK